MQIKLVGWTGKSRKMSFPFLRVIAIYVHTRVEFTFRDDWNYAEMEFAG